MTTMESRDKIKVAVLVAIDSNWDEVAVSVATEVAAEG